MKLALGIEYRGSDFYGWQVQPDLPTVQGVLEEALEDCAQCFLCCPDFYGLHLSSVRRISPRFPFPP